MGILEILGFLPWHGDWEKTEKTEKSEKTENFIILFMSYQIFDMLKLSFYQVQSHFNQL